jgi:hypothetical protein
MDTSVAVAEPLSVCPSIGNKELDVLHDWNQVILNLYPPQSTPPRSFQTESCSVSKRSFHKVLADLNISF